VGGAILKDGFKKCLAIVRSMILVNTGVTDMVLKRVPCGHSNFGYWKNGCCLPADRDRLAASHQRITAP